MESFGVLRATALPRAALLARPWGALAAGMLGVLAVLSSPEARQEVTGVSALRRELAAALGNAPRPVPVPLVGGFLPGPYRPGVPARPADRARFKRVALRIRAAAERHRSVQALADAAVLELLTARPERAVAMLEEAVRRAPIPGRPRNDPQAQIDPANLSDLAAAYLAASDTAREPYLLFQALATVTRATAADPQLPEASFSLALALERLSLRTAASRSWQDYLLLDSRSAWAVAARRHLRVLHGPSEAELWRAALPGLRQAALGNDGQAVDRIVSRFRMRARKYGERDLLAEWARWRQAGQSERAARALAMARGIGSSLALLTTDSLLQDSVAAIDRAQPRCANSLAAGHLAYARGLLAYERYELATAHSELSRAGSRLESCGSPLARWAAAMVAACDYQDNRYDAADDILAGLAASTDPNAYPALAGRVFWSQGVVAIVRARHAEARALYRRSLALYRQTGEVENVGNLSHLLFEYSYFVGDLRQAWRDLLPALQTVPRMDEPRRQYIIMEAGGIAALAAGEPRVGLLFQDEALRWARRTGHAATLVTALRGRAGLREKAGMTAAALSDAAAAIGLAEKMPAGGLRTGLLGDALLADGELASTADPARAIVSLSRALDLLRQTEYFLAIVRARHARARAYRAAGDPVRAEEDLIAGMQEVEEERPRVAEPQRASFLDGAKDLFSELAAIEIDVHRRPDQAYRYLEQAQARVLMDRTAGVRSAERTLTIGAVEHGLPPGVLLLQYAVQDKRLLAWAISSQGSRFAEQETEATALAEQVDRFRERVERAPRDGEEAVGSDLASLLLAPFADQLHASSAVIFVPDGVLGRLPFAALPDPLSGKYLIEKRAVGVAPSARFYLWGLKRLQGAPRGDDAKILLVGNPALDREFFPDLPDLPAAAREVAGIAKLYRAPHLLTGPDATREAFLAQAEAHDILQVAGHAFDSPEQPELARLILAPSRPGDSGALYARELLSSAFTRPRLAVLSACGTASGASSATEGAYSLARAFLAAGVPQVIATLWQVRDRHAEAFSLSFHRRLIAGTSPLLALRQAQLDLLRSGDPALASPAAWAAFESVGSGGI